MHAPRSLSSPSRAHNRMAPLSERLNASRSGGTFSKYSTHPSVPELLARLRATGTNARYKPRRGRRFTEGLNDQR